MKKKSKVLRIELELRSRFLRLYGIKGPYDFGKLVEILLLRHIYFARFNKERLVARLLRMGFSAKRVSEILDDLRSLEGDVWASLNYLKQELELKNTRRFLDPLDTTNGQIIEALERWAAMWPSAPTKVGKT